MNTLGDRLRELRMEKDLEQKELANILQVHKGTVSNWENNKRSPDNQTLIKIADYFEVSVDFLLGRVVETKVNDIIDIMESVGIDIDNIDYDKLKQLLQLSNIEKKQK